MIFIGRQSLAYFRPTLLCSLPWPSPSLFPLLSSPSMKCRRTALPHVNSRRRVSCWSTGGHFRPASLPPWWSSSPAFVARLLDFSVSNPFPPTSHVFTRCYTSYSQSSPVPFRPASPISSPPAHLSRSPMTSSYVSPHPDAIPVVRRIFVPLSTQPPPPLAINLLIQPC